MGVVQITAPAVEPVGLLEAKDHLRVDHTDEDALIDALIMTARRRAEKHTGRALITQTWDWTLDGFPVMLCPPKPPLLSVASIKYFDGDDAEQTLSSAVYQVDVASDPGRIVAVSSQSWPSVFDRLNAVTVQFAAGYGPMGQAVPWEIKAAILLIIGHLYKTREDVSDKPMTMIDRGADALLAPYVSWKF